MSLHKAQPAQAEKFDLPQPDTRLTREVAIALRHVSGISRPAIGVSVESVAARIDLPFDVRVDVSDVTGPSAGLMVALATYQLATPTDLLHGRIVAGTGTIDLSGNVGPIGGIGEKVAGAERDGATLFLAPAEEAGNARDVLRDALC